MPARRRPRSNGDVRVPGPLVHQDVSVGSLPSSTTDGRFVKQASGCRCFSSVAGIIFCRFRFAAFLAVLAASASASALFRSKYSACACSDSCVEASALEASMWR